jgi:hypothetical protein
MCRGLAGDERCLFEIEDPVDDVADLAHPAKRLKAGHAHVGCEVVHRVLMTPKAATALTHTPR